MIPITSVEVDVIEHSVLQAEKVRAKLLQLCHDKYFYDELFQTLDRKRRHGELLTPEEKQPLEQGLRALRDARKELANAWRTPYQTHLVGGLPGIEQLANITDLRARLSQCERLGRAFLERWRRHTG
jgi:hypothetical protein